jgi:hypothetical protein
LILEKLPVALTPPVLKSLREKSVIISINLRYGVDEIKPEFYQIQYKNVCRAQRNVNLFDVIQILG